ncbi:MAG: MATE family efflux transporter [Erysipelotrichaceae bacterium]|nr:MATE family efflux transporter [Erysipelotrichaceae bacterium]
MKYLPKIKEICYLAWPAVIQEALSVVVSYIDTAMVGTLGANASASVGLTGSVNWLTSSIVMAFGVGILSVCAKADGAGDQKKLQIASQQSFYFVLGIGILMTIVCMIISPYLPTWLNGDEVIRHDAYMYFLITSITFLFRSSALIFASTLRSVKDMKTPMMINIYMNVVNIVLNFFLIYPSREIYGIYVIGANLGVIGAAIATSVSYVFGGVWMFFRYLHNERFDLMHQGFHFNYQVFKECVDISLPVVMERSVICFGHVTFASMIATMGVIPLAAHTIAIQAEQAFYCPGYGFQSAASTLVGNAVGEKDANKVKQTTYLICAMTSFIMLIAGILLFINARSLMGFFTPDSEVIAMGTTVLRIVSVSEPIYGVLVILEGTFNGMGDTKAPFVFSCITMWGVRIFGSYIVIHVLHMGLAQVWVMMVCDNVLRCILLLQRFLREKWRYLL